MEQSGLPLFSQAADVVYLRRVDAEKHKLFYTPRVWLSHQRDLIAKPVAAVNGIPTVDQPGTNTQLSIYGEVGIAMSGSQVDETGDGVTSIPATRHFDSASSDFVTAGVLAGDILEISSDDWSQSFEDNGRYQVVTVVSATRLLVDRNWPTGSLTDLDFSVHMHKDRYLQFGQLIPFMVSLNPTEKQLKKWGISEQRDAVIELSIGLLDTLGLIPKIGDRFLFDYGESSNGLSRRVMTYEIVNLFEADAQGDSGLPLHYIGLAKKAVDLTDLSYVAP